MNKALELILKNQFSMYNSFACSTIEVCMPKFILFKVAFQNAMYILYCIFT